MDPSFSKANDGSLKKWKWKFFINRETIGFLFKQNMKNGLDNCRKWH